MRKFLIRLCLLAVVALGFYGGYWYWMAGQLRDRLDPWADSRRADGYTMTWDSVGIGGFPFEFRLRFAHLFVAAAKPLPYELSGADIVFWAAPWNLERWHFEAPLGARIDALLASAGFDAQGLTGEVTLPLDPNSSFAFDATGLAGRGAAQGMAIDELRAAVTQPATPPAADSDPFLYVDFAVKNATVKAAPPPFGGTIQEISADIAIDGAMSPAPVPQMLADWRNRGGIIQLTQGHLHWDTVDIQATGTLALDDQLQPLAALTAKITGQDAIVDAAVQSGNLRPNDANLAKAVLGLISQPGANGQKQVTLPISAQNQRLYLGPAAIARIPMIDWDEAH